MQKILLAFDGSESCNKAINKVRELTNNIEAQISIIHVIEERFTSISDASSSERIEEETNKLKSIKNKAKEITSSCEKSLIEKKEGNKNVNKIVEFGNPAEIICIEAVKGDYDLVVVADVGKSAVKKFFLGSTTEKVVRHCEKSVLVVK